MFLSDPPLSSPINHSRCPAVPAPSSCNTRSQQDGGGPGEHGVPVEPVPACGTEQGDAQEMEISSPGTPQTLSREPSPPTR